MKVGESLVCYIFAQQKLCFKIWSLVHYVCVSLSLSIVQKQLLLQPGVRSHAMGPEVQNCRKL